MNNLSLHKALDNPCGTIALALLTEARFAMRMASFFAVLATAFITSSAAAEVFKCPSPPPTSNTDERFGGGFLATYQFCRKAVDVWNEYVIQGFRLWQRTLGTPHEWHQGNCEQH